MWAWTASTGGGGGGQRWRHGGRRRWHSGASGVAAASRFFLGAVVTVQGGLPRLIFGTAAAEQGGGAVELRAGQHCRVRAAPLGAVPRADGCPLLCRGPRRGPPSPSLRSAPGPALSSAGSAPPLATHSGSPSRASPGAAHADGDQPRPPPQAPKPPRAAGGHARRWRPVQGRLRERRRYPARRRLHEPPEAAGRRQRRQQRGAGDDDGGSASRGTSSFLGSSASGVGHRASSAGQRHYLTIWKTRNKMAIEKKVPTPNEALFAGLSFLQSWEVMLKGVPKEQVQEIRRDCKINLVPRLFQKLCSSELRRGLIGKL